VVSEEDHRKLDGCLPVLPDPFWQQKIIVPVRRSLIGDPAFDYFQTGITAAQLEKWLEQKGYASVEAARRELQLQVAISHYSNPPRYTVHDTPAGSAQGLGLIEAATGQGKRRARRRKQRTGRKRGSAASPSAVPGSPRVGATSLSSARATPTVPTARMRPSPALILNLTVSTLALALSVLSMYMEIPTLALALAVGVTAAVEAVTVGYSR
jgi:hypothetical protein